MLSFAEKERARIRRIVRTEIKECERAFQRHIKENNCNSDSGGCTDRAAYQERLFSLNALIKRLGGRAPENYGEATRISDYTPIL